MSDSIEYAVEVELPDTYDGPIPTETDIEDAVRNACQAAGIPVIQVDAERV